MGRASNRKRQPQAHHSATPNTPWQPLYRAIPTGVTLYDPALDGDCYKNGTYTVFRRVINENAVHLSIRRNDREPCKDWRDFQRIKNELCGAEWEAVELYPAESRLVDSSNQYHLWCSAMPFNFGWEERCVTDAMLIQGAKQRPLPDDWQPSPTEELARVVAGVQTVRAAAKEAGVDLRTSQP